MSYIYLNAGKTCARKIFKILPNHSWKFLLIIYKTLLSELIMFNLPISDIRRGGISYSKSIKK